MADTDHRRPDRDENRKSKALAHPLRARIYAQLQQRTASPVQLSREIGLPIGNVAYHVKVLAEAELIHETGSRPARGALEHFYTATDHDTLATTVRLTPERLRALLEQLRGLDDEPGGAPVTLIVHR